MTQVSFGDFSSLMLGIYRLTAELPPEQFQDEALKLLKTIVPFDSSMWGTATAKADGIDIHTIHLHQKTPEMLSAYEPLKHHDTSAQLMFQAPQSTRHFQTDQIYTRRDQREFRDFLRRFGQENTFITATNNPNTKLVHWISLYRADRHAPSTEDERLLLDQLAPHIMQALTFNRVMHMNRTLPSHDAIAPRGTAIADLRGVIYHLDPAFYDLMRLQWTDWRGETLPPSVIESMLGGSTRYLGQELVLEHKLEQSLLFIQLRKRYNADNLTMREHTVALLVAKGATYKEIAAMLHRAPATVRNHIQSIYEKLQVSNIAGLIDQMRLVQ